MRGRTKLWGPVSSSAHTPQVLGSSGHCFQNTNRGPRMQVLDLGSWALCWEGRVWVSLSRVESEGFS